MPITVGILGASGYTGAELLRLLSSHRETELVWVTSEKFSGMRIDEVFPSLKGHCDLTCQSVSKARTFQKADVVFSCLPQGTSMHFVGRMLEAGSRVVDMSADFRFRRLETYERTYGAEHKMPDLLDEAAYGLPELYRDTIIPSRLVANPGCFSTGTILGFAPLASQRLIDGGSFIADSKAGMSGPGRAPTLDTHFVESNENVKAEGGDARMQHAEMEERLLIMAGSPLKIVFVPHRLPYSRGIYTSLYLSLKDELDEEGIYGIYRDFYADEHFVRMIPPDRKPTLKSVRYSNYIEIGIEVMGDIVCVFTALDNLGKGASGQAVQNMNLMFGFPETLGLESSALFP